jgi:hypothetical protein
MADGSHLVIGKANIATGLRLASAATKGPPNTVFVPRSEYRERQPRRGPHERHGHTQRDCPFPGRTVHSKGHRNVLAG